MADTRSVSRSLLIESLFVDGDTRTITLKNPSDNISMNDIADLSTLIANSQVLVGDRNGAAFNKIKQARRRNTTTVHFDLNG